VAKGPNAFRTISEAADTLGVPQHVLRFWETKFSFIRPMKRAGGRRFYRPQDVAVLSGVRALLHGEGLSIRDVQQLHREQGLAPVIAAGQERASPAFQAVTVSDDSPFSAIEAGDQRDRLALALEDLHRVKARLDGLLNRL
jgi:DNA-binding transcriptional MerR regulator